MRRQAAEAPENSAPENIAPATEPAGTSDFRRERPEKPAPGRGRNLGRFLLLFLLLLGLAAFWVVRGLSPVSEGSDVAQFEVLPGWGAATVAEELEAADIIRNALLFRLYLQARGLDRSIGEGLYDLDRADAAPAIADRLLAGGRPRITDVLLPEGFRAVDMVQRLAAAGVADPEELTALISEPGELRPEYVPAGAGLEGYLFPASYEIPHGASEEEILGRMLERFEDELDEETAGRLEELGFSVHEWVTLASMIQSEAGNDEEMPVIAGVFLNRLEVGMPLQSDPTVAYGLGKRLPELDPLAGDMRASHPWNTYLHGGLPPGPISNPGSSALQAVFEPQRTDEGGEPYLYFLHGSDGGEPVFRLNTDLDGHNRDIERYLRNGG